MEQTPLQSAITFTFLVWERFSQQREKFEQYINLLSDLRSRGEDRNYGFCQLKKIFVNDQDLLFGLNNFLPMYHHTTKKIPITDIPEKKHCPDLESTIEFVNKVKKRFANDNDQVFVRFCDIMSKFQDKRITVDEVDKLLDDLFRNDPDLYVEFTRFLVGESEETEDSEEFVLSGKKRKKPSTGSRTESVSLYEENLVIWERYRYEMDLYYLSFKSTYEKLDAIVKQLDRDLEVKVDTPIRLEEFKRQDLRCIEKFYGSGLGKAMVQKLLRNPKEIVRLLGAEIGENCREIEHNISLTDIIWMQILEDGNMEKGRHNDFLVDVKKKMKPRE